MDFCYAICTFLLIFLLEIVNKSKEEQPLTSCTPIKPFRHKDGCVNFIDICVKSDDENCKLLLASCEQCPASNLTSLMLLYIQAELKSQKTDSQLLFNKLESKMDLTRGKLDNKTNIITILLSIIIVINLLLVLILFLEIRFKLISRCLQSGRRNGNGNSGKSTNYQLIKNKINTEQNGSICIDEIRKLLDEKVEGWTKKTDALEKWKADMENPITKFIVHGIENPIELIINENDCIIQVKKQIIDKIPKNKNQNIKNMKLRFAGKDLDDNQYLLSCIGSQNVIVHCQFDSSINVNDIIVLKLHGNCKLPELIQIRKNATITELKTIITRIINIHDFIVLKETKSLEKLTDNLTIDESKLKEDDLIKIIIREKKSFEIKSIFNEKEAFIISCYNMDQVSSLYQNAAEKFNCQSENFILFLNYKYLEQKSFIYELNLKSDDEIKFCCLMKADKFDFDKASDSVKFGDSCEIYTVTDPTDKAEIILKRYKMPRQSINQNNNPLIKELISFQITKSNAGFVKLLGVYRTESHFFVALENFVNGSVKQFVTTNGLQTEKVIAKWSIQILEGLKFLHDHKIIHRDLKPTNIFLDENNDIKLSGFDLSKYAHDHEKDDLVKGFIQTRVGTYRYMAPEIHDDKEYGIQVDVWSFGIVMIEIITNKKVYEDCNELDVVTAIYKSKKIEWEPCQNTSNQLIHFINSCLKYDPTKRATIEQLLEHEFLKVYK